MVPASPNFISQFLMRAIPKGLTFGLYVYVYVMCMFCKSPEVTLCGLWGYKPSINMISIQQHCVFHCVNRFWWMSHATATVTSYCKRTTICSNQVASKIALRWPRCRKIYCCEWYWPLFFSTHISLHHILCTMFALLHRLGGCVVSKSLTKYLQ